MILQLVTAATPSPLPTPPGYAGDPNDVTPGPLGFAFMLLIALVVIALILDMNRRIRRVRYRAEVAEKLDAERAASAGAADGTVDAAGQPFAADADDAPAADGPTGPDSPRS